MSLTRRFFLASGASLAAHVSFPLNCSLASTVPKFQYISDAYSRNNKFISDSGNLIVDISTIAYWRDVESIRFTNSGASGLVVLDSGPLGVLTGGYGRGIRLAPGRSVVLSRFAVRLFKVVSTVGSLQPATSSDLPTRPLRLLLMGQSLASMWEYSPAFANFAAGLRALGDDRAVSKLNMSIGGSAAIQACANPLLPNNHWWNEKDGTPGPLLLDAIAQIEKLKKQEVPNVILWIQGEQDSAHYVGNSKVPPDLVQDAAFRETYRAAVAGILTNARAALARAAGRNVASGIKIPVLLQRLGPREGMMDGYRGMTLVRMAQQLLVSDKKLNIHWGARPGADMPLRDVVHPTDEGFARIGKVTAAAFEGLNYKP